MNRHAREYFGLKHINLVAPPEQRPVCQYCARPLKPKLHWPPVWAGKGEPRYPILLTEPPPGALAWGRFRDFEVQVWLGEYQGYGRDEMGVPLFCRLRCGFAFAQVMYRGGERIQRDGRVIQRYQPCADDSTPEDFPEPNQQRTQP